MTNGIQRIVNTFVGPPIRVPTKEDRLKATKRNVRDAVIATGGGFFTTREELEELRKENSQYDFRKQN